MENDLPEPLEQIIQDFQWSQGREKLELLIDYAERLPPLPDWLRDHPERLQQVHECMTPVFVHAELQNGGMAFFFDVPAESPTVRGYAALLQAGLHHASPEQVLRVPNDFFLQMGLHEMLTSQRLNGIAAILAHMKRLALEAMQD